MPKLAYPRLVKGGAITCLLDLYWDDPAFMSELQSLRQPYAEQLMTLATAQVEFWLACRKAFPPDQYRQILHDFHLEYALKGGQPPELPGDLAQRLKELEQQWSGLQPYVDGLHGLAWKWKLRARWAVFMLVYYDIVHIIFETFKLPKEVDVPLDVFDDWYPWPPPLPALEIKVSSWAFIHCSREEMLKIVGRQLREHEEKMKSSGLREYPSAIARHAELWFKHYVGGKTYAELGEQYLSTGQESIKRAVWNLSKLVGIKVR